jgi:hypothetical protein
MARVLVRRGTVVARSRRDLPAALDPSSGRVPDASEAVYGGSTPIRRLIAAARSSNSTGLIK